MQRRMAGRFYVVPYEVDDILAELHWSCRQVYFTGILKSQIIEENWEAEGDWVVGEFTSTKIQIISDSKITKSTFYETAFNQLIEAGLLRQEGSRFILPMLKKKIDVQISPMEVKAHEERLKKLEKVIFGDGKNPPENSGSNGKKMNFNDSKESADQTKKSADQTKKSADQTLVSFKLDKEIDNKEEEDSEKNFEETLFEKDIKEWISQLWSGRRQAKTDAEYIAELKKFPPAAVHEAFRAAMRAKIKRGNFDWILNRLENPGLYKRGYTKGKKKDNNNSGSGKRNKEDWGLPHWAKE